MSAGRGGPVATDSARCIVDLHLFCLLLFFFLGGGGAQWIYPRGMKKTSSIDVINALFLFKITK